MVWTDARIMVFKDLKDTWACLFWQETSRSWGIIYNKKD
jgi:hypothetical protein